LNRRAILAAPLLAVTRAFAAPAAFANPEVVLLQPEDLLRRRIAGDGLAAYIRDVAEAADAALANVFRKTPAGGLVVIALKPPRRAKVWLDVAPPLPAPTADALGTAVLGVQAPAVTGGVVVFALKAVFWGGRLPTRAAPAPAEWKAEAARLGAKLEVGELVERLWPD
jgi:hypothetical protein